MRKTLFITAAIILGVMPAAAHTITFTWTWPTTKVDGTAMPLSSYGAFTVFDTSVPTPGSPGTPVACPITLPPTTATGTCTTGTITASGHSYVATTQDNATPPNFAPVSNSVGPMIIPLSGPAAITNLSATVN